MGTKQICTENATWNVRDEGQGPVLLLVHGFPLNHRMWDEQFAGLTSTCRLIAPDLRGFGDSRPIPETLSMEQLADDLVEVLNGLSVTEPVVLVGLSMGGYVAWQFWAHHVHRLRGLVLCDTRAAADAPQVAEGRRRIAERVLSQGAHAVTDEMVPKLFAPESHVQRAIQVKQTIDIMNATSPRTIASAQCAMAARPDMTPRLSELRLPVLAICGEHDRITPTDEMRSMADRIPGAQYVEIAHAGHMAPLEQPQAVNEAIERFVARLQ